MLDHFAGQQGNMKAEEVDEEYVSDGEGASEDEEVKSSDDDEEVEFSDDLIEIVDNIIKIKQESPSLSPAESLATEESHNDHSPASSDLQNVNEDSNSSVSRPSTSTNGLEPTDVASPKPIQVRRKRPASPPVSCPQAKKVLHPSKPILPLDGDDDDCIVLSD